jgi:hypothetical protein
MKNKPKRPSAVLNVCLAFCLFPFSVFPHGTGGASQPYVWRNVAIRGGGFVTGIITHPKEKGLMYARTDVGGAYRWDENDKCWTAITDWIGMADANLTGIESLAADPSDPDRVYLAAGTYTNENTGNGAVLRSSDRGRTFRRTDLPFKMGGNEAGRFHGERLAVDPNQGGILFFGSRNAGLWKSADSGATWSRVDTFPDLAVSSSAGSGGFWNQPVGVVFVQFDAESGRRGKPTPVVFAGISVQKDGLQLSTDYGETWAAVSGQPAGLRPNHAALSADGSLYLSYGKEPGPNAMTDGAVWKYNLKSGAWTDVTPVKPDSDCPFGYGGVGVDASHPETVMVTTFCRWNPRDEVFRTADGGKTWKPLLADAAWDRSNAPWTEKHTPHWMGDVEIDPFDSRAGRLYMSEDSAASFSAAAGSCLSVTKDFAGGFGKSAPGKKDPALFLAGKVDGAQGLFRSDDGGRSWVRIDDERHRFGWVNHVTGDPRVYGRVYFGTGGRGIIKTNYKQITH